MRGSKGRAFCRFLLGTPCSGVFTLRSIHWSIPSPLMCFDNLSAMLSECEKPWSDLWYSFRWGQLGSLTRRWPQGERGGEFKAICTQNKTTVRSSHTPGFFIGLSIHYPEIILRKKCCSKWMLWACERKSWQIFLETTTDCDRSRKYVHGTWRWKGKTVSRRGFTSDIRSLFWS